MTASRPLANVSYADIVAARAGARSRDIPCPVCGPQHKGAPAKRKVLRTWTLGGDRISLHCARCGLEGWIAPDGGSVKPAIVPSNDDDERQRQRNSELVDRTWRESVSIISTAGEIYLRKRGIEIATVPDCGGLRWHPRCPWGDAAIPCIIARFTDAVTTEPRGIWRRPIDGQKPKALGPMKGCVIRLWPDEEVSAGLVLGEGVETTLAAALRIEHRDTLLRPAWAAGSADNMRNFPVLSGVEALTLLVDHDASGTGQDAAAACALRQRSAGREVTRLKPPKVGTDFNDVIKNGDAA